ncbi:MAG: CBS and ACT domain-containing protein [Deltaproteobacteria bacterium]|nr:CBS and ACT domain-containing protein [Deltaproteobacteria bacterium]
MQVQNWMSTNLVAVDEDTPIVRVSKILEDHRIRHLPVMREGALAGLILARDVREALPSRSTGLSAQELYYLLSEVKARDVMQSDPITIRPDQTMELAAAIMLKNRITAMPVVTGEGALVGIISQGDVFKVLIAITGIYQGGVQFAFNLEDSPGSIKQVADVIREEQGHIVSILSMTDTADPGFRHVFIRIKALEDAGRRRLVERLDRQFMLLYTTEDPLEEIRRPLQEPAHSSR